MSAFKPFNTGAALPWGTFPAEVEGCEECNRTGGNTKPWPVFTIDYHGQEVCAKCLTPIHLRRRPGSVEKKP